MRAVRDRIEKVGAGRGDGADNEAADRVPFFEQPHVFTLGEDRRARDRAVRRTGSDRDQHWKHGLGRREWRGDLWLDWRRRTRRFGAMAKAEGISSRRRILRRRREALAQAIDLRVHFDDDRCGLIQAGELRRRSLGCYRRGRRDCPRDEQHHTPDQRTAAARFMTGPSLILAPIVRRRAVARTWR